MIILSVYTKRIMKQLAAEQFSLLIQSVPIKPILRRKLRFNVAMRTMTDEQWRTAELLAVSDRNGSQGY